jgi:hypothetical protein
VTARNLNRFGTDPHYQHLACLTQALHGRCHCLARCCRGKYQTLIPIDGIPLAIEFAAARVATLGVQELAARLDDLFRLPTGGRRTALPHHQTLRATLDWSYELLPEVERTVLRRLGVLPGPFVLEATLSHLAQSSQYSNQSFNASFFSFV